MKIPKDLQDRIEETTESILLDALRETKDNLDPLHDLRIPPGDVYLGSVIAAATAHLITGLQVYTE